MSVLTNAHTHLELGWLADACPDGTGRDFLSWWLDTEEQRRKLTSMACFVEVRFREAAQAGIEALKAAGTTHFADISTTGSSIYPLMDSGMAGVVYVEARAQYAEQADRALAMARYVIEEARPKERNGVRVGLALPSPLEAHPALLRKAIAYAEAEALPLCIHISQSPAEYEWLAYDRGPIVDLYREQGLSLASPRKSPVQYLADLGALALKPLLVHATQVDVADVQLIKESGSHVVHCPRSDSRLQCGQMPLELFLAQDVPMYLGTESLACSPSLDVREEAVAATELHAGQVTPAMIQALLARPLAV